MSPSVMIFFLLLLLLSAIACYDEQFCRVGRGPRNQISPMVLDWQRIESTRKTDKDDRRKGFVEARGAHAACGKGVSEEEKKKGTKMNIIIPLLEESCSNIITIFLLTWAQVFIVQVFIWVYYNNMGVLLQSEYN